ncbi:hypothetical protein [Mycobacterium branderi]|uniref:Uncharacterized protein n=1 Tax=Mycobacterium branderi TaxID=43348 RepID=A0A7I7WDS9_9MYCO|nr:hypothetical protein [Mycobacterium branderi]MCV7236381.1 hypothetical protein [Mycobacterium branderi]ORA32560.1 hypothetical protein BST20_24455 [Mycobacterium branderi]BBZ15270.1 hypothetical protein MBRA_54650 [Mycobacterium branderi]
MSQQQLADPVADGQAWALRQQEAFPQWVARHGGGDPDRWDFGLDSLNVLSYIVFDRFPTREAIDDPGNAEFSEPATWYLGEIVRRSDPKKLRWSRRDFGLDAGHYVVEPTARTQAWAAENPQGHLRSVAYRGDPMWLRSYYTHYVAPLWGKPWPAWIHSSETGAWSWDETAQRWVSQRDRWRHSIAGLLTVLAAQLPDIALDYSTVSLQAVEIFTVANAAAQEPTVRDAVIAYVGECLLRSGGGRWIWDEHPEHLTNGFPVAQRSLTTVSPAHLIEYARARRDGQTFARVHRAWIADTEDNRRRGDQHALQREPTPGLDQSSEQPTPAEQWASQRRNRFADWIARYGAGQAWDFTTDSLDALAEVVLEHCPAGTSLLDAATGQDFVDGAIWYLGETLHRAKPSRWSFSAEVAEVTGRAPTGLNICANVPFDGYPAGFPLAVYLLEELDGVVRPTLLWEPDVPQTNPKRLRDTYDLWVTALIRERISQSQKRREQARRRAGRRRSDEETLSRWLTARTDGFPGWVERFGSAQDWDFSVDSLDALEALIRRRASGPEELLEDKVNADFVEGAAWYFGEVLRRHDPDGSRWSFERSYHPEPYLSGGRATHVAEHLATVYAGDGGVLRRWWEAARTLRER